MSLKDNIDFSTFTDLSTAFDLYSNSIRRAFSYDSYGNKTKFQAIVLTNPMPMSPADLKFFTGTAEESQSSKISQFVYRARIIGENSPHQFLPDPCNATFAVDETQALKVIEMHTLFVSNIEFGSPDSLPNINSIVEVQLEKNTFGYNLQYGKHLKLSTLPSKSSTSKSIDCDSLKNIMDNAASPTALSSTTSGAGIRSSFPNICSNVKAYEGTAATIGIPKEVLASFVSVESGGKNTAIRFEPHKFNKSTATTSGGSDKMPFTNNGSNFSSILSETNKAAFDKAFKINAKLAIESTSWGLFQVLGSHLLNIESDPEKAVKSFYDNPEEISKQLVGSWFESNPSAKRAANSLDFDNLARIYNGPKYARNNYHINMRNGQQAALKCNSGASS
tara:strand:+ start:3417 stop:4589 length:1173 start_codon:yes stop_codon:yes gene_type:complete